MSISVDGPGMAGNPDSDQTKHIICCDVGVGGSGYVQVYLVFLGTSILRAASVPRRSCPIVTGNLMSTSLQGASGPGVHVGIRPAFGQPVVSVNHMMPQPTLTWLNQVSGPEQSIIREIKKLIVRLFVDTFGLRTNELPGGEILPSKRYCHSTRCVSIPPKGCPPD